MEARVVLSAAVLVPTVASQGLCALKAARALRASRARDLVANFCGIFRKVCPARPASAKAEDKDEGEGGSEPEMCDQQIERGLAARRLDVARSSLVGALFFGSLLSIWMVFTVVKVLFDQASPDDVVAFIPQAFLLVVLTGAFYFAQVLSRKAARQGLLWICTVGLCAVAVLIRTDTEFILIDSMALSFFMLLFSFFDLRFRGLLAPHALLAVARMASAFAELGAGPVMDQVVAAEIPLLLFRLSLCSCVESRFVSGVRLEVESKVGRSQQVAVMALLDMMCDAVVDLDEDLCLKDHSVKLAGMLMHGPGRLLKGDRLLTFIAHGDDQARAECILSSGNLFGLERPSDVADRSEGSSEIDDAPSAAASVRFGTPAKGSGLPPPSMVTVHLRDAIGNKIKTCLLHVPYESLTGTTHHLVGLCEEMDPDSRVSSYMTTRKDAMLRQEVASKLQRGPAPGRAISVSSSSSSPVTSALSESRDRAGEGRGQHSPSQLQQRRQQQLDLLQQQQHQHSRSQWQPRSTDEDDSRIAEIYVADHLPLRWASQELREEFGIAGVEGGPAPRFGPLLPNGGAERLLGKLKRAVNEAWIVPRTERHFLKDLGEWPITRTVLPGKGTASPEQPSLEPATVGAGSAEPGPRTEVLCRRLWVSIPLPFRANRSRSTRICVDMIISPAREESTGQASTGQASTGQAEVPNASVSL